MATTYQNHIHTPCIWVQAMVGQQQPATAAYGGLPAPQASAGTGSPRQQLPRGQQQNAPVDSAVSLTSLCSVAVTEQAAGNVQVSHAISIGSGDRDIPVDWTLVLSG